LSKVIERLRGVLDKQIPAGLGEGELLRRYVQHRDESAFTALVRRHGPMVMGVCRRVLHDPHDAEDAFQATFLVLVRKAATLRSPELLANWLYGVAYRTALEAKTAAARRRAKEAKVVPRTSTADAWTDLLPALDQELDRLPEKYRAVVVLCDLEGKTRKEAAGQLGWPEGTVASRLAGARVLLAKRLARHGVAVAGGTLGALLSGRVSGCVPDSLVASTVEAATLLAAGRAMAAGAVPAVALAEGVLKRMLLRKLKVVPVMLAVALLLGLGIGGLTVRTLGTEQTNPTAPRRGASPDRPAAVQAGKEVDSLEGAWTLVEIEFRGLKFSEEEVKVVGLRWVMRGDTLTETARGKKRESTIRLDPTRQPKQLILTVRGGSGEDGEFFPGGSEKGTIIAGIYRVEKDRLTLCFNAKSGKEAPEKFETGLDSDNGIYVLKRLPKDAAPPKKPTEDLPGELAVGKNKLQQLGIALFKYHEAYGRLPPPAVYGKDGKALLSWRVLLLPHFGPEYGELYNAFKLDEAWDSPNNKKLLAKMPQFYASPATPTKEKYHTYYQVLVGKKTAFAGREGRKADDLNDLASTVLVVEGAEAVPWTKPQDLAYDEAKALPKLGGPFVTGFHALYGFTQIHFHARKDFDAKTFRGDVERAMNR
jgi:RNA polymerase sigma factor (sigma-70 family)